MRNAVNPVRNSSGALNPALRGGTPYGAEPGIILKSNPAAAAGPASGSEEPLARREGLPPGHEPFRGGAWPGGPPAWRASGSERAAGHYF